MDMTTAVIAISWAVSAKASTVFRLWLGLRRQAQIEMEDRHGDGHRVRVTISYVREGGETA